MQDAFNNPPASVYETYEAGLSRHGIDPSSLSTMERGLLLELVAYTYTCAVGRMCTKLPPPDQCRRSTDKAALQMRDEALQVLQEVAMATDKRPGDGQRLNG